MTDPSTLALFWAAVIAAAILIYVLLDGFDIGVGILFGTTRDEAKRGQMMNSIAPFWDGNETWLVVIGASLFAAFPAAYAVFLGAFYLPVLLMLVGLIFRGIAFEFRYRSVGMRRFWDAGFAYGSMLVAFVQGAAVGAMMRGIPVENMQYAGDAFTWLHPFPVFTGIGLMLGYALLGACWIVLKTEGALRDWAYTRIPWLVAAVCVVLGLAFITALTTDFGATARSNLGQRSWGLVLPMFSLVALLGLLAGVWTRRDAVPLAMAVTFFCTAFLTLAVMFWPHLIPYAVTVADAAAPDVSLRFFFYAGIVVLPVIVAYTIGVYWVSAGRLGVSKREGSVRLVGHQRSWSDMHAQHRRFSHAYKEFLMPRPDSRRSLLRQSKCARAGRGRQATRSPTKNHRRRHADRAGPVAVRRQLGGRETGRRQADHDRRGCELDRLCRSPGAGGGPVTTEQFIMQWDEGADNFIKDPPNATISVLGGDGSKVEDAVVTLRSPKIEAGNLTFDVSVLEGSLSGASGPAALFIDRGGGGGGFGGRLRRWRLRRWRRLWRSRRWRFWGWRPLWRRSLRRNDRTVNVYHDNYWHAPVYHGAWYAGAPGVALGAAAGLAATRPYYNNYYNNPYAPDQCGYYPFPPCY